MAIGMGTLLMACSVDEPVPSVSTSPRPPQAATPTALQTLSRLPDDTPHTYDTSSRRDPFKPLIESAQQPAATPQNQANCPPMQEFELSSLKLVAIVWGEMGRKAMFKAPNGRGYAVAEDMLVGRNCGRVLRIESTAVIIEETRQDTAGRVLKEEIVLRLREREG
jgi:Tfp pilus assembly protein PilP